jgi:hypothetical protein
MTQKEHRKSGNDEIEILLHPISFYYKGDEPLPEDDLPMPESEQEHVREMIEQGYYAGELNYVRGFGEEIKEWTGWWQIISD